MDKLIEHNGFLGKIEDGGEFESVVYYKNQFSFKHINQIGDGMIYFKDFDRSFFLIDKINNKFIEYGLSIYRYFDENEGIEKSYFFKFDKNKIQSYNSLLQKLNIDGELNIDNKFVKYDSINLITLNELFGELNSTNSIDKLISFLIGLIISHGTFKQANGSLNSIQIHIPLNNQLSKYESDLVKLLENMKLSGIDLKYDLQQIKIGNQLQIVVNDFEIFDIVINLFGSHYGLNRNGKIEGFKDQYNEIKKNYNGNKLVKYFQK